MNNLDLGLAIVFLFESGFKIIAQGTHPWKFFYGKPYCYSNCFDFMSKRLTIRRFTTVTAD